LTAGVYTVTVTGNDGGETTKSYNVQSTASLYNLYLHLGRANKNGKLRTNNIYSTHQTSAGFGIGKTTVVYTLTDASKNVVNDTFNVTVLILLY
jgi:hypothetical protein